MSRGLALDRLFFAIRSLVEHEELVPCLDSERGHLWLSDHAAMQEAASHGCSRCPALSECLSYVTQYPEPAGVWAARPPRTHRIKKAS